MAEAVIGMGGSWDGAESGQKLHHTGPDAVNETQVDLAAMGGHRGWGHSRIVN